MSPLYISQTKISSQPSKTLQLSLPLWAIQTPEAPPWMGSTFLFMLTCSVYCLVGVSMFCSLKDIFFMVVLAVCLCVCMCVGEGVYSCYHQNCNVLPLYVNKHLLFMLFIVAFGVKSSRLHTPTYDTSAFLNIIIHLLHAHLQHNN